MLEIIIKNLLKQGVFIPDNQNNNNVFVTLTKDGLLFEFDGGEGLIDEKKDLSVIKNIEGSLNYELLK